MEYIINPMWFYWIEVADTIKEISIGAMVVLLISAIILAATSSIDDELERKYAAKRCGECKWYDPLDKKRPFFCPVMDCATGVMEDDFCTRGERRAKMEAQDGK